MIVSLGEAGDEKLSVSSRWDRDLKERK